MRYALIPAIVTGLLATDVLARDVPANIKSLYKSIRAKGTCSNILKGGFYSQEKDSKGTSLRLKVNDFLGTLS